VKVPPAVQILPNPFRKQSKQVLETPHIHLGAVFVHKDARKSENWKSLAIETQRVLIMLSYACHVIR
jgi:hypothetical protein